MQDEKAIIQQMIEKRRIAHRQGCRITRWKLPSASITKLEREIGRSIDPCGLPPMLFGAVLVEVRE